MVQQLNLKHPEAHALASELAGLTGESLTEAVLRAIRERLDREHKARDREERVRHLLEIAQEIRDHVEPGTTSDHSWLYGEDGLPE
jgi:antitoxin VapB